MDPLARLLAREAIRDVTARYCRAIDRLDADLMLSVYHADAVDEVPVPPRNLAPEERQRAEAAVRRSSPAEFVAWVMPLMRANYISTSHCLNQQLIEFLAGDRAHVETYYSCVQVVDQADGRIEERIQGRYVDEVTERGGEWKIAHRFNIIDSYNATPATPWAGFADPGQPWIGRNDKRDYSYTSRAAMEAGT